MKKIALAFALMSLVACSKSVSKNGNIFSQTEPPDPTPVPVPTVCEPNRLGELLDFAVYVKEDVNLDRVNVGKRVAGADVCVQHGQVGVSMPLDASRADLAASSALGVNVVKIPHGKATYGKTLDKVRSSAKGGFVLAPTDLAANFRRIHGLSSSCDRASPNTQVKRECRRVPDPFSAAKSPEICTLTIWGDSAVNVADLTSAQIANVAVFVIDIPAGTSLVTNLPETRIGIFRGVMVKFGPREELNSNSPPIFWNFPAADSLEFTATRFRGTIIAPDASVKVAGQVGEAGFWARELKSTDSNW